MNYNSVLESVIFPLGDFLNKSSFIQKLKEWRKMDTFSSEELSRIQKENLKKILIHAQRNVSVFQDLKLDGDDPYEWIKKFPVLEKNDLKSRCDEYLTRSKDELVKYSSSGSSGIQSSVYMDKEEQSNIRAILIHWWEWAGYSLGDPLVQTGITPNRGFLKSLKDLMVKTIYIDAFSHTKEQLDTICKVFEKNPGKYFMAGYASSIFVIAEHAKSTGKKLTLRSAISFGDKMFYHYRNLIENTFNCKVYDTYGCNEGFLIASQKDLEYKYIMTPHVYLEILDDDGNEVPDGEQGHVVVTRLDSFSMPLIRYRIGDLAIKLPIEEYPDIRAFNYPLLKKIVGRNTDIVKVSPTTTMNVHSFTGIFEYIPEIKQFQVVQKMEGAMEINYIKDQSFQSDTLNETEKKLRKYIDDDNFKINFIEVEDIPPAKSGKPEIIINKIVKK